MSQDLQHEELDHIGKPPSGWQLTTLGEIADVQGGITKGKQRTPNDKLREVRYLRVANVQRGFLDLAEVKTIEATEDEVRQFQLRPGDVLFNEGGDRDKLGRGWIWSGEIAECIHQNHVFRARIHGGVLVSKILSWYGNSEGQTYFLREGKQTTNLASLNSTKLRALPVLIPPGPEQQRIVAAIESYFTRLDDAVATLERVERNLKRYRASVLKSAVEGRLVPTEAALAKQEGRDYEPASVLLERILSERRRRWADSEGKGKYQEPAVPDKSNLPVLPEGWCWASAEAVSDIIDPQPSHRTPPEVDGGVPYVGMGDVELDGQVRLETARRVGVDVLDEHRSRYELRDGDFVFGKIGTLGRPALLPQPFAYTLSANLVLVQPDVGLAPRFLFQWMQSPTLNQLVSGGAKATSQPAFGIKKVRTLPVPIAPLPEQARIVAEVERQLSVQMQLNRLVKQHAARLARLRQSILKWAFEGKLADQDPSDEPASALLARIKAERDKTQPAKKKSRA